MRSTIMTVFAAVLLPAAAYAQTPACDALPGEAKKLARELLSMQHPYACCDRTIAACLQQEKVCSLAYRLAENICRRVAAGQDQGKIVRWLSRRARSMLPSGKKAGIDLERVPVLGEQTAPVVLVEYACARCPFCAKITPGLVEAITKGALQGKVKLYFKLFPIRSHQYSKEAALGFMAAAEMGKFWQFMRLSYERFDAFCIHKQVEWAREAGLDSETFRKLVEDPAIRARLVESKKEGIVNKVEATPTFFINGRKYVGDPGIEELVDVLLEEYERVTGVVYRTSGQAGRHGVSRTRGEQ